MLGEKYGDVFSVKTPGGLLVVLNSYDAVKEAFELRGADFADRPSSNVFDLMGFRDELVYPPYSVLWLERKTFAMRVLKKATSDSRMDQRVLSDISKLARWLPGQDKPSSRFLKIIENCIANVATGIVYGADYDLEDPECFHFISIMRGVYDTMGSHVQIIDFLPKAVSKIVFRNDVQRMSSAHQRVIDFLVEKILEHRESFDPNILRDIIDEYLHGRPDDLDERRLSCSFLAFLVDGIDTTTTVFKWLLVYILNNPHIQEKMQTLLDKVNKTSRKITLKDRSQLGYIDAVILVTLRFSSPIPLFGIHKPLEETNFRGYRIPTSAIVYANFYAVHRDQRLFTDPDCFLPERFTDDEGKVSRSELCLAFSKGKRRCLGEYMAKKELFLFVSNRFSEYTFSCPPGEAPPPITVDPARYMSIEPTDFNVCVTPR